MTQITTLNQEILDLNTTKQELKNDLEESHDIIKEAKKGILNDVTPPYCCMPIRISSCTLSHRIHTLRLRNITTIIYSNINVAFIVYMCGFRN